jgi:hypothetical protein
VLILELNDIELIVAILLMVHSRDSAESQPNIVIKVNEN